MGTLNRSTAKVKKDIANLADADRTAPGQGAQRLDGDRGSRTHFNFDGKPIEAFEGESIAAALLVHGMRAIRFTDRRGEPRGLFCNMGICFDCLVEVNGQPNQRACQYQVSEGLEVKSQKKFGPLEQSE